jgi:hypothetical protein
MATRLACHRDRILCPRALVPTSRGAASVTNLGHKGGSGPNCWSRHGTCFLLLRTLGAQLGPPGDPHKRQAPPHHGCKRHIAPQAQGTPPVSTRPCLGASDLSRMTRMSMSRSMSRQVPMGPCRAPQSESAPHRHLRVPSARAQQPGGSALVAVWLFDSALQCFSAHCLSTTRVPLAYHPAKP